MTAIGAKIECDDVACMYATIEGSDPNAKRIVMGSHCDSVKNGGNYDGIEGVMTGMEVLETVAAENIPHKHPLTAMIWTNEEGSLYPPAMMVSGIICYDYLPDYLKPNFEYENMMASKPMDDSEFANFGEALAATKFKGPKENRISPDKYCAMFETHLEQGPILEDNGNEIGAVQLVMGMFNYRVRFHGFTAHAGTFPMAKRHDALHAAAEFLCKLHERYDAYNKELLESGKKYDVIIAIGPVPMMKFVVKTAEPFGVPTRVSLNPIMIDGTGMCGGCRVSVGGKMKFACVDGPEFDGYEVDFDELMNRNATYREQEAQMTKDHMCRFDKMGQELIQ